MVRLDIYIYKCQLQDKRGEDLKNKDKHTQTYLHAYIQTHTNRTYYYRQYYRLRLNASKRMPTYIQIYNPTYLQHYITSTLYYPTNHTLTCTYKPANPTYNTLMCKLKKIA